MLLYVFNEAATFFFKEHQQIHYFQVLFIMSLVFPFLQQHANTVVCCFLKWVAGKLLLIESY